MSGIDRGPYLSIPPVPPGGGTLANRMPVQTMEKKETKGFPRDETGISSNVGEGAYLSSEKERATLLASVLRLDAERKAADSSVPPQRPRSLASRLAALAASTALAVYVWFGSPFWLNPDPGPLPPLAAEASTVRASVWLAAQQVKALEDRSGRIPGPQEIGSLPPGIRYERLDAHRYLIIGQGSLYRVTYTSGDAQDPFLEAALELLTGDPPR